jgi:hypothetical protein
MSKPLGIIVDQNQNPNAVDVYALVLNYVVVNTILASYNEILNISSTYDYCVDITMNGQADAGIGYTYNASLDQFIAPPSPPINWVANAQNDFDSIISAIQQILIDVGPSGGNLAPSDIQTAYNSSLNDNPGLDAATLNLLVLIYQYVLAGG